MPSSPARKGPHGTVFGSGGKVCRPQLVVLAISVTLLILCRASAAAGDVLRLTDKTFDSVREAFNYPSMLVFFEGDDPSPTRQVELLAGDELLRGKDIMLATVKGRENRMLAARFGVDELPTLIFFHNERMFRHQGGMLTSGLIRSYALLGYLNQGGGEEVPPPSRWLLAKFAYREHLLGGGRYTNGGGGGNVNLGVALASGFALGLAAFASTAIFVCLFAKDGMLGGAKKIS